jgi:uncharacterized protein YndB with AHSA1/START domain
MSALPGDEARVTIGLAVDAQRAFEVFTQEIDLWWRRGPRFRNARGDSGIIALEPGVGGRVFESFRSGGVETIIEIGRTRVWEPPRRLVFGWRNVNFAPAEETEVEVLFEPAASGTRVTVMHRGWSHLRSDHPVRHGLQGAAFIRMNGLWWADLLRSLATRLEAEAPDQG